MIKDSPFFDSSGLTSANSNIISQVLFFIKIESLSRSTIAITVFLKRLIDEKEACSNAGFSNKTSLNH